MGERHNSKCPIPVCQPLMWQCTQGTRKKSLCVYPAQGATSLHLFPLLTKAHSWSMSKKTSLTISSPTFPSELHKIPLGCLSHSYAASLCCLSSRFTSHILLSKTGNQFHWGFIWALLELILQVSWNALALKNGSDFYPTFPFQM